MFTDKRTVLHVARTWENVNKDSPLTFDKQKKVMKQRKEMYQRDFLWPSGVELKRMTSKSL